MSQSIRKLVFPNQYLLIQFFRSPVFNSHDQLNPSALKSLIRHTEYQHLTNEELRLMKRLLPVGGKLADALESSNDETRVKLYLQMLLQVYAIVRSGDLSQFQTLMADDGPVAPILTKMFCQTTIVDADLFHFFNRTLKKSDIPVTIDGFSEMSKMHSMRMRYCQDPQVLASRCLEDVVLPSALVMLERSKRLLRASISWVIMDEKQKFKFLLQILRDCDTEDLMRRRMETPRPTEKDALRAQKYIKELKRIQTKLGKDEQDFHLYFAHCARQSMTGNKLQQQYLDFLLLEQPDTGVSDLKRQVQEDTKLLSGVEQLPPEANKQDLLIRRENFSRFISYRAQIRFVLLHSIESPEHVEFISSHNYPWETFRTLNRKTFEQLSLGIEDARKILSLQ